MKFIKLNIVVSLLLSLFFIVGCDDSSSNGAGGLCLFFCDENPMTPENGTISGVVDFSGAWPETGIISISLNTSWPEVTGAPYAFTTIYSDDLNQDSLYSYRFENIIFGTYKGIIVSWKDPYDDNAATNQHAIGGYGGTMETEFEDAESVIVSVFDYEKSNLNFQAYLNLIDETAPAESGTISGTVTFSGIWPTGTVFMSLNALWPLQSTPDYYSSIVSENIIDNKYNYSFENVTFGIYTVAVIWLNPAPGPEMSAWETLGAYGSETPPDFEDAESIMITGTDFEFTGLDFTATFSD